MSSSDALLGEVDRSWQLAPAAPETTQREEVPAPPIEAKLDRIVIPLANFAEMELHRVVDALGSLSVELDPDSAPPRGVNLVLVDPAGPNPAVNLTLRDTSLRRVLDLVTQSVGYEYEVQTDAVVIRPMGAPPGLDTKFFPVSRATVLRMTSGANGPARNVAAANANSAGDGETKAIRDFLQQAGVDFAGIPGSTVAFDGSQLIATQTGRNLQRIRNILTRYSQLRQVAIEAKFMEVQQGALEEVGVQWSASTQPGQRDRTRADYVTGGGVTRSLAEAFRNATSSQQITITGDAVGDGLQLPTAAPALPGGVLTAANAQPLANIAGIVGSFDVNAIVRALSQKSGTELLSAPKLTVLSGNPATITIAQEMRYPQSYGQIQSQVGTGSLSGGGSAGVSITSGTPQEFTTRNVGVELRVTPTVEEDDRSISLELNPKVTEFEGFVEYGGPSVAISGGTTVTVPPGFYQPIFAVREVSTRVTLWDGATLVMGGLTREDVKKVKDKVPVLGSLPGIGRLFRTRGESTQKRNLLIFVTANLVNPGGALQARLARSP